MQAITRKRALDPAAMWRVSSHVPPRTQPDRGKPRRYTPCRHPQPPAAPGQPPGPGLRRGDGILRANGNRRGYHRLAQTRTNAAHAGKRHVPSPRRRPGPPRCRARPPIHSRDTPSPPDASGQPTSPGLRQRYGISRADGDKRNYSRCAHARMNAAVARGCATGSMCPPSVSSSVAPGIAATARSPSLAGSIT